MQVRGNLHSYVNKLLTTSHIKNVATRALYDIAGLLYLAIASNEPMGDITCQGVVAVQPLTIVSRGICTNSSRAGNPTGRITLSYSCSLSNTSRFPYPILLHIHF